ncbi:MULTISPECIES: DUF3597 domain-containing protein [Sphingomonas]|uniref:DUF3597 domain-containing protein n=1 Tax=Sphingomonas TaxID=13687 RepID=UPI000DEEBCC9|nr:MULTISPECIES: DUF3597 domain-containing protein [Sphingomonas]
MSFFGKIKDAIFGHKSAAPTQQIPAGMPAGTPASTTPQPQGGVATAPAPAPATQQQVDVEQVLQQIAQEKGNPDLNYKTSIVDLMKLLGIDSSLENRKELAKELGYTGALDGSAEMNIWLHKATMKQLAANGGKVPASMLD